MMLALAALILFLSVVAIGFDVYRAFEALEEDA